MSQGGYSADTICGVLKYAEGWIGKYGGSIIDDNKQANPLSA